VTTKIQVCSGLSNAASQIAAGEARLFNPGTGSTLKISCSNSADRFGRHVQPPDRLRRLYRGRQRESTAVTFFPSAGTFTSLNH